MIFFKFLFFKASKQLDKTKTLMCYLHTFNFFHNKLIHIFSVRGYDDEAWDEAISIVKEDFNIIDEAYIEENLTLIRTDYSYN